MIGAKTLGTLCLLVGALTVSLLTGVLRPERLLALRMDAALVIGALAVVLAGLMYRFWGLGERSARYFRLSSGDTPWEDEAHFLGTARRHVVIGANVDGEAFELSPTSQYAVCLVMALLLGLGTINARALSLLFGAPSAFTAAGSTYCPDETEAERAPSAAEDPSAPGCALIRRAYEMGYAKSLGDCGAKQKGAARERTALCTLRQRDEPALHYAWRLLSRFGEGVREQSGPGYFARLKQEFDERMARLEQLYGAQQQVMASAPHASHHIWTNLPNPGGAFDERTCTDRYRELPYRPKTGEHAASNVFEHVLAQLLFESRYEPAAGYCREYHVHWGAPKDACKKLAEDPEGFLRASGALEPVRATLRRYELGLEADRVLQRRAGEAQQKTHRALQPQSFLSFQCYVEGEPEQRANHPFTLDGEHFEAAQISSPSMDKRSLYVDRYRRIATLMAPSFHYGALLSEAGLSSIDPAQGMNEAFAGKDFLLSRAHSLSSVDVFLEPEWLAQRADLLEVYPYHVHLKNYVRLFRQQYLLGKGRL